MDKDTLSTTAGGALGVHLLTTVNWNLVPFGEIAKIVLALVIIFGTYFMYRQGAK